MPRVRATVTINYDDEYVEPADGNAAEQVEELLRDLLYDADLDTDDVYCVEIE